MKPFGTLVVLLFLVVPQVLANGQYSCKYTDYFSSCTATNTGGACAPFTYMSGGKCLPRKYWTQNCISWLSETSESVSDPSCLACGDGWYLHVNQTYTETNTVKDWDNWQYNCKAGGASVKNCKWGVDTNRTGSIDGVKAGFCYACEPGFYPLGTSHSGMSQPDVMPKLFKECTATNPVAITNCAYMGMSSAGNYQCYACKAGFALDSTGTNCVVWTKDTTCAQVDSTKSWCVRCWWPWWFFGKICMASHLNQFSAVLVAILMIVLGGAW